MGKQPNSIPITRAKLILSANRALLCEIHPNMREIDVEYIEEMDTINFYVYFDSPATDDEKDSVGAMVTEMISDFPQALDLFWNENVIVLPYPNRIPNKGICVYRRYEPTPEDDKNG